MCGICGIWNYRTGSPIDRQILKMMMAAMKHRGPDDSDIYVNSSGSMGLGFQRLAIIDLSKDANQPLSNEDGSLRVVFNGEIYNYPLLRKALEENGHHFRSNSDTETIVHQYEDDGPDCVKRFIGMFAFGVWDSTGNRLLLARDHVGKKPLYYFDDGVRLVFASELKALLQDQSIPRELDLNCLMEYLRFGYVGSPKTILQGINKLPPGTLLLHRGYTFEVRRYWDWINSFKQEINADENEYIDLIREHLRQAVKDRLHSDVPLGAFLSGGIDSSAVVAIMADLCKQRVKTFSIGFEDQAFSELSYARIISQAFNTEHHEYVVKPELIEEILPRLIRQLDEPFGDSSMLPTYYLAKMAHQEVTVCLSGDGGDEAMAGYPRYGWMLDHRLPGRIPLSIRRALLSFPLKLVPAHIKGWRMIHRQVVSEDVRYALGMETFNNGQLASLFSNGRLDNTDNGGSFLLNFAKRAEKLDALSQMQYIDLMTYLPEDLLTKVDRMSMLNSLEVRSPLLDVRFLNLAARIPADMRLKAGECKYIFKRAFDGVLPKTIIARNKMGFTIPGTSWLNGKISEYVREVLSDRIIKQRGIFRNDVVQRLLRTQNGLSSYRWDHIWSLLVFELWCQEYLKP